MLAPPENSPAEFPERHGGNASARHESTRPGQRGVAGRAERSLAVPSGPSQNPAIAALTGPFGCAPDASLEIAAQCGENTMGYMDAGDRQFGLPEVECGPLIAVTTAPARESAVARHRRRAGGTIRLGRVSLRTVAEFAHASRIPASGEPLPTLVRGSRVAATHPRPRPRRAVS